MCSHSGVSNRLSSKYTNKSEEENGESSLPFVLFRMTELNAYNSRIICVRFFSFWKHCPFLVVLIVYFHPEIVLCVILRHESFLFLLVVLALHLVSVVRTVLFLLQAEC